MRDGTLVRRTVAQGAIEGDLGVPLLIGSTGQEFNALIPETVRLPDGGEVLGLGERHGLAT